MSQRFGPFGDLMDDDPLDQFHKRSHEFPYRKNVVTSTPQYRQRSRVETAELRPGYFFRQPAKHDACGRACGEIPRLFDLAGRPVDPRTLFSILLESLESESNASLLCQAMRDAASRAQQTPAEYGLEVARFVCTLAAQLDPHFFADIGTTAPELVSNAQRFASATGVRDYDCDVPPVSPVEVALSDIGCCDCQSETDESAAPADEGRIVLFTISADDWLDLKCDKLQINRGALPDDAQIHGYRPQGDGAALVEVSSKEYPPTPQGEEFPIRGALQLSEAR